MGIGDPFLDSVSPAGKEIIATCFIMDLRTNKRDPQSGAATKRPKEMAASTLRGTVSLVGAAYRSNGRRSPMHISNGNSRTGEALAPTVGGLLKALEAMDPPPNQQPAATDSQIPKGHAQDGAWDRESLRHTPPGNS